MKRIGLVLCLGAASLALAATAGARGPSHPTKVFFDGADTTDGNLNVEFAVGHVTSPSPKCVANRTVKVFFGYSGEDAFTPVDVAKTSKSGAFAGEGPESDGGNEIVALKFKVLTKKFGPRHHRQTCRGTSLALA
jgi:hypothetical protein